MLVFFYITALANDLKCMSKAFKDFSESKIKAYLESFQASSQHILHHIGHSTVFGDTIFGSVGDVSLRSQSAAQYALFHMPSGRVPEMKRSQAISKNDTGTQANTHLLQPGRHILLPYINGGSINIQSHGLDVRI